MTYREVIETLSNNLSTYFAEVYHSAEIVTNDKGIKQPMVALGDEWISLVPTDQRETVYIRRNGDDEIYAELKLGSCEKAYQMRSSLRIVFFKDHAKNHVEILSHLMKSVLVGGTKLKSIIQNKWKLLKDESSGDYNFGATTAYFAIDIYALWNLIPDNCEEDFCVEVVNPLTCGPVAPSTTPGIPVPPVDETCCITVEVNGFPNDVQNPLNLVNSNTATFEYLGNGEVTVHCECGEESGGEDCCPEFQTNSFINDFQEVLNLIDSDTIEVVYELDGKVSFHIIPESGEESGQDFDWHILGNLDTTFGTNFLGTINNVSLEFRTNNLRSGMIDISSINAANFPGTLNNQTSFGQGALRQALAIGSTAFGYRALYNLTTGDGNTAVGYQALMSAVTNIACTAVGSGAARLSTALGTTAFGHLAASMITTGTNICAIGGGAMQLYTAGSNCTAVGGGALGQGSGGGNTAVGYNAMGLAVNTGDKNTAIGIEAATHNSSGSSGIFLGYHAGYWNSTEVFRIAINSINCISVDREDNRTAFGAQQNAITFYQFTRLNGRVGINNTAPTSYLHLTRGTKQENSSPVKFVAPILLVTTAGSAVPAIPSGFFVTLTYASTTTHQFVIGSVITVAGVTPVAFNGDHIVSDCTETTVTWFSLTDPGVQTVAGTISQGELLTVPEPGAMEYTGTRPYFTGADGVRGFIPLTFTGTAAPATTPSNLGDNFLDTVNKKYYVATGTASSADWSILN